MRTRTLLALLAIAFVSLSVFAQAPASNPNDVGRITIEELKAKIDKKEKVLVVDVRTHTERVIKGAKHIPLGDLEKRLTELPKDRLIVTVCA